jgi:hypothetical protein
MQLNIPDYRLFAAWFREREIKSSRVEQIENLPRIKGE